jgi:cellulose 1,4-beta-cellobiosidase
VTAPIGNGPAGAGQTGTHALPGTGGTQAGTTSGQPAAGTAGMGTTGVGTLGVGTSGAGPAGPDASGGGTAAANVPSVPRGSDTPRVDNPFADAKGYVNPQWKALAMAEPGGERVASTPTAVWLDRIAAIAGTGGGQAGGSMGLRDHLDAALAQGARYIELVIYNLPGRDCSALASNGELGTQDLPRYKTEYIDPIASTLADGKYQKLRIITIVEIDSLPNLVTNTSVAKCAEMKSNGGYVEGITYALQTLGAIANVYNYLDAAHHGWLGWDNNLSGAAELFAQTAKAAGVQNVHGFITNTANYSALEETFLRMHTDLSGTPIKNAKFLDFNPFVDELSYAQALRTKLIGLGLDANLGMLIDTSRNGWGGPARPSAASSSTNVDTFVNESRIDRRIHAGNWCNQSGAGLGERPRANPAQGIDAYVWVKPPGESDGASQEIANKDGKGFDRMCDPTYGGNERNGNGPTGAVANAPLSGAWFSAQFQELMRNAHPPL